MDTALRRRVRFDIDNSFGRLPGFQIRLVVRKDVLQEFDSEAVRFFDDEGNPLAHELESHDDLGAVFWVKSDVDGGDSHIWMYDGGIPSSSNNPISVWNGFSAVFHFAAGSLEKDSTDKNEATCDDCETTAGLNGGTALQAAQSPAFTFTNSTLAEVEYEKKLTISLWYKKNENAIGGATLISAEASCVGWKLEVNGNSQIYSSFKTVDANGVPGNDLCNYDQVLIEPSTGSHFHHVVLAIDREKNKLSRWVDGALEQETVLDSDRKAELAATITIGRKALETSDIAIDEVRLLPTVATAAEIRAHHANLTNLNWAELKIDSVETIRD